MSALKTAGAAAALMMAVAAGCSTNEATGRSQFNIMSREEEISLGTQAKPELVQEFGGEVERQEIKSYVTEVGAKLSQVTEGANPTLPWEFTVLDSDVINAFALPGGKVFISRGLMAKMTNEAQLAGVLGHEVGHVTARHTNDRYTRAIGMQLGLGVAELLVNESAVAAAITQVAAQGTQIALLSYDRGQELESDSLGMRYMTRIGYNPAGQAQVMQILKDAMSGERGPEMLSTHPFPETRIEAIEKALAGEYAHTQANTAFKLGEADYQRRFLKLASIAYPHAGQSRFARYPGEGLGEVRAKYGFGVTSAWCAHCRAHSPP
jgi:predicted Zn-dependent protease